MLGMISTAKHNRIVAEKDAEIAKQKELIKKLSTENIRLRLLLSPFKTPRARNAKGQFTKDYAR